MEKAIVNFSFLIFETIVMITENFLKTNQKWLIKLTGMAGQTSSDYYQ